MLLLLDRGPLIEACDNDGKTALILAAQTGKEEMVDILLNRGARVDAEGNDGISSLESACKSRHSSIVEALIHRRPRRNTSIPNRSQK